MNEPKKYIAKGKRIGNTEMVKIGFKVADLVPNERGYCNVIVAPMRNGEDQYGNTHTVWIDDWKPDPNRQRASMPEQHQQAFKESNFDDSSTLPF